jgi:hypothetical protein
MKKNKEQRPESHPLEAIVNCTPFEIERIVQEANRTKKNDFDDLGFEMTYKIGMADVLHILDALKKIKCN